MSEPDSDRAWDEYEWERFLQQQDQKTEKYMELLEKYIDDPNRDELVSREMGWTHINTDDQDEEWRDDEEDLEVDERSPADLINDCSESFEQHVLYRASFNLTIWIDRMFENHGALQNDPAAVRLATHAALAAANPERAHDIAATLARLTASNADGL